MSSSKKKFQCNFFPTVGNAKEADLKISERQDFFSTDFEILKITKHLIVFFAAAILQL